MIQNYTVISKYHCVTVLSDKVKDSVYFELKAITAFFEHKIIDSNYCTADCRKYIYSNRPLRATCTPCTVYISQFNNY